MEDPTGTAPAPQPKATFGLDPYLVFVLCYVGGWTSGLFFLLLERKHREVRFHAVQSMVVFAPLSALVAAFFTLAWLLREHLALKFIFGVACFTIVLAILALWARLMLLAYNGREVRLPLATRLALRLLEKLDGRSADAP